MDKLCRAVLHRNAKYLICGRTEGHNGNHYDEKFKEEFTKTGYAGQAERERARRKAGKGSKDG